MKKSKIIFYTFLLTLTLAKSTTNKSDSSAITYKINGGRLGDNILNYIKAKWISYSHNIPLFYAPFKYSDQLMLNEIEKKYNNNIKKSYKKTIELSRKGKKITNPTYGYKSLELSKFNNINKESNFLYISIYNANANINWENRGFLQEIKTAISPIKTIPKPKIPENCVSVAVHVRKGGGFDLPLLSEQTKLNNKIPPKKYADKIWPLKFPPDEYYIEQIRRLHSMLDQKNMHVHIFTDDKNPERIINKYKKKLEINNITFSCREKDNHHSQNVIEDFFSMTYYDCLIRSLSNFAVCADIIGDFLIVIYPESSFWKEGKLIIDKVKTKINTKL